MTVTAKQAAELAAVDATTAAKAAEVAIDAAARIEEAPRREAAERADRVQRELLGSEASFLQRMSPRRNPWPEMAALDARIAGLDAKGEQAGADMQRLSAALREADAADRTALSKWHEQGGKGTRPTPRAPAIRDELERTQADREAIADAGAKVAAEKASYVESNRKRLARVADDAVDKLAGQYRQAVDEAERVRADLLEARAAALFVRLYPSPLAGHGPPTPIALGLRQVMQETLGTTTTLQPDRLFALLRHDAALLPEAMDPAQREALGEGDAKRKTIWADTEEGQQLEQSERREALANLRQEWGT